jgi:hypothetical protein
MHMTNLYNVFRVNPDMTLSQCRTNLPAVGAKDAITRSVSGEVYDCFSTQKQFKDSKTGKRYVIFERILDGARFIAHRKA